MQHQPDNHTTSASADILEFSTAEVPLGLNDALLDSLGFYTPICDLNTQGFAELLSQPIHQDNHELIGLLSQQDDGLNSLTSLEFLMSTFSQASANNVLNSLTVSDSSIGTLYPFLRVDTAMGINDPTLQQTSTLLIPAGHSMELLGTTQNIGIEEVMESNGIFFDSKQAVHESTTPFQGSSLVDSQGTSTDLGAPLTPNDGFPSLTSVDGSPRLDGNIDRFGHLEFWFKMNNLLQNTTKSHLPQRAGWLEPTLLYITLLPYIKWRLDFTAYFCPPEQKEISTEDRRIICQLQGHITAHSTTSFSFSNVKCGYTTHQYGWNLDTRSEYLMHVLKDHLGFSWVEWSRDEWGFFEQSGSVKTQIRRELIARILLSGRQHEEPSSCDLYDELGFLSPLFVFLWILNETSINDLLERVIPVAQRPDPPLRNWKHSNKSSITCRLEAYISERGQAKWINMDQPCGQLVVGYDNYRRHLLEQHFGIKRGKGDVDKRTWDRLLAAIRANMRLQDKVNATTKSRKSTL